MIAERRAIKETQPAMNSVQNKQNVLGIYQMAGSVLGPGDTEIILEVTDM